MTEWSEAPSILAALRDNPISEAAWEQFYYAFHPRITLLLHALGVRDREAIKDLAQQVFFQFLAASPWRRSQWKDLPDAPVVLEYLRAITRNLWRDHLRRHKRDVVPLDRSKEPTTDRQPFDELYWKESRNLMDALSVEERQLVVLRYVEGLSLQELADILGISRSAAAMRMHRIQDKLRRWKARQEM